MPRKRTTPETMETPVIEAPAPAKAPAPKKPAKTPKAATKQPEAPAPVVEAVPEPKASKSRKKAAPAPKAEAMPVSEPVFVPAPEPGDAFTPHARTIMNAIQAGQAVEFIFQDAEANPPRTFEARHLIFDVFTGAWFAWGWDRRYNAERHHRLDQLAEVNPVEGPGRAAQGPFAEGTPANQIGGWRGGESIPVKAVLQKQWIFAVRQAPAPFPEFKLEDIEDGKAVATFIGTDLRAIARWCMQFGDGIQVQEPQRLVDRIKQVGIAWAGKAAPAPAPQPKAKAEAKPEPKAEPRHEPRHEPKPEPRHESRHEKPEPRQEAKRHDAPRKEHRESKESEAPKAKPARVEVRFERL